MAVRRRPNRNEARLQRALRQPIGRPHDERPTMVRQPKEGRAGVVRAATSRERSRGIVQVYGAGTDYEQPIFSSELGSQQYRRASYSNHRRLYC